ncbi:hypothetical protein BB029_26805 [Pseudomonas sp. S3E12]|nr:hypothetical protein BB029_26805 [Pseudomonas sp. S3E12]
MPKFEQWYDGKKEAWTANVVSIRSITEQFAPMLRAWLSDYDTLMPALHHYFTVQDESQAYNDTKFLAIAQALAAFHRRMAHRGVS